MTSLSSEGKRLIYSFEGLHKALSDGRYAAYLCPAGVPTIYCGLTKGVRIGMVITTEEGERRFADEIKTFEDAVSQMVTVPLNQNEADALISFAYNCGIAALKGSTLLKKLNKGDKKGAAAEFAKWNKATVKGRKVALGGLTSRRTRESALFQKPLAAPAEPYMPQTVEKSREPLGEKTAATVGTAAAVVVQQAASIPTISDLDKMVTTGQHVRSITEQAGDLGQWLYHSQVAPFAIAAILIGLFAIWKSAGTGSSGRAQSDSST